MRRQVVDLSLMKHLEEVFKDDDFKQYFEDILQNVIKYVSSNKKENKIKNLLN